ncbi:MAG: MgtC/SapB family protein [Proteobacteria bacterium]|nr:MgtC/SapB family protein [Pseudomonadota bacterium]
MRVIDSFSADAMLDSGAALGAAFVLGALIGAERQYRQRNAGLRTNALVAVAAATFVDLAYGLTGSDSPARVIASVVSGIGFLGAGAIMKEGLTVRGLNEAATLWCSAAVGACAGAGRLPQALLLALFTLIGNTVLRPVVNRINRTPFDERASEATYKISLVVAAQQAGALSDRIGEVLAAAKYPVGDIEETARAEGISKIVATLVSTSADRKELDAAVAALERLPGVAYANWSASTRD